MASQHAPEQLLAALDPEQLQVAQALEGPVVVLAGAGTGKTRAITHRIAHAVALGRHDPQRTLAVTFTNRAAGEMTRRLAGLGVEGVRVRTFHSAALRQLKWAWPQAIGGDMQEIITSKQGLISAAAATNRLTASPAIVRDLATEIEWAKSVQVGPGDYTQIAGLHGRRSPAGLNLEQAGAVYADYERAKRAAARIDFEDVLLLTVAVLEENESLRRQVQNSFAHFTVDEFQDVSGIQERLLGVWLGDRKDVCVVGDVAQTIYSFAGANPAYLTGFAGKYPNSTVVQLTRCYRCSPQVVAVAEKVIGGAQEVVALAADPRARDVRRLPLRSQAADGPDPRIAQYSDESAEAAGVVQQISRLAAAGVALNEIAVLVRINAATQPFESALADAGIPYSVRGGRRFFERPEVRKAVALLRGALRASSATDPQAGTPTADIVTAILSSAGWTALPPADTGAVREAWESLAALVFLADEVCARTPGADLQAVVDEIARRDAAQDAPAAAAVTLASLHAAKGMEWDAVFVVGLVDGVVPMSHAITLEQIEEERRLLYVAVTRARRHLSLSWAQARTPSGRVRRRSRFLADVDAASSAPLPAGRARKRVVRKPAACRVCGKALVTGPERSIGRCRTCPSTLNEELLQRLQAWRAEQIAALSADQGKPTPSHVVATDATLSAIAELTPTSLAELAEIPGLGATKLERHGQQLLEIVKDHSGS